MDKIKLVTWKEPVYETSQFSVPSALWKLLASHQWYQCWQVTRMHRRMYDMMHQDFYWPRMEMTYTRKQVINMHVRAATEKEREIATISHKLTARTHSDWTRISMNRPAIYLCKVIKIGVGWKRLPYSKESVAEWSKHWHHPTWAEASHKPRKRQPSHR